ncbi:MAG: nitrate transporter substrate-binding protein [Betaproteobacteria bacterium]|jgi:ABC-type nitrate/sulfonate/bicarbonate transport system substrate-binding protein|nr:nitrate transporter substrate-binding protein [Betaproteobacteria bacterium]
MIMTRWTRAIVAGFFACAALSSSAYAQKIKVGYWTSGVSLGFGSTLEQMKFLEKQGLEVEWIKFGDVNAPTRAIVSNAIDVAFGASTAGALSIAADGVPVKIFLATQLAEVQFVVPEASPIKSLAELRGKKVGMSPPGSATHSLAIALLEGNYGLKPADYTTVPGNEPRLAQFLMQGEVQAAALRGTTIAQMNEVKLRVLGNYIDEWKKLTKSSSAPVIGVGMVHSEYLAKNPEAVVKFVIGMKEATDWGARNTARVAEILQKTANLPADDAQAYAKMWSATYVTSFEAADIAMLKKMAEIFKQAGTLKNNVPDSAFAADPYIKAKSRFPK